MAVMQEFDFGLEASRMTACERLILASGNPTKMCIRDSVSGVSNRFHKIFKNTVSSIASSGNIIVLKTLSGCANAAGEAIDSIGADGILGCLAGDNTVFVVVDSPDHVPAIVKKFSDIIGV